MGKLKIGFVLDDSLDTPDGVQQYILTLGTWLIEQGHEVHYLVGHTTRTDIPRVHSLSRNIRVTFNGNRMTTPLPASKRRIKTLLRNERFDVLHVQIPYSPYLAQRIISAAQSTTAVVGTFHIAPNSALVYKANRILAALNRRSLKRFDDIFAVSKAAADFAENTHHIKTSILPNVVKADHFKKAVPFLYDKNTPTIVFLGRLVPRKGCQVLLKAIDKLVREDESLSMKVIICGRGELESQLKVYVTTKKLTDIVEFAGFVDNDVKARYLRSADIAVFPSTGGESFGIVLLEAMAAEHPVVLGAANDGYKTVLGPNPDLLFPIFDHDQLAAKLKLYIADTVQRKKALDWQKGYIRKFDVNVVGPRLVARYTQALRSRQGS